MKISNVNGDKTWNIGFCKNGKMAKWNDKVTPRKVQLDGAEINLYAFPEKSDYIYFQLGGVARFIWCKDGVGMDVLNLKKLKVVEAGKAAVMVKAIRVEVDEVVDMIATENAANINGENRKALVITKSERALEREAKIQARRGALGPRA